MTGRAHRPRPYSVTTFEAALKADGGAPDWHDLTVSLACGRCGKTTSGKLSGAAAGDATIAEVRDDLRSQHRSSCG